jgi:medium-chain acyl-[acyl-carrier-protein] hydrolase
MTSRSTHEPNLGLLKDLPPREPTLGFNDGTIQHEGAADPESKPQEIRLFCFPFAGGTSAAFNGWQNHFGKGIELYPVEYPGHGSRGGERRLLRLELLVDDLSERLGPTLHAPFAFLGHSLGAIVAFELTRALWRRGAALPIRLFVSASRAPQIDGEPAIHDLPDSLFLHKVIGYGGIPRDVIQQKGVLAFLLPTLRDDFCLIEEYRYQTGEPLPVPISVMGGLQDSKVPVPDILAWSHQTTRSFRSRLFPGGHFFSFDNPSVLVRDIVEDLRASVFGESDHGRQLSPLASVNSNQVELR